MAGWFAKLMQKGHTPSRRAIAGAEFSKHPDVGRNLDARDARYDAIVQTLRDREVEDRAAREKRQRGYRQSLESDSGIANSASSPSSPIRLSRCRTKVPCQVTPEARALLDEIRKRFSGSTVSFPQGTGRQQAVMVTRRAGAEPKQIGWVEHCVQTDPKLCNVRDQGLSVETDGGGMLVLRFRYPPTAVRMSSRRSAEEGTLPHGARRIEGRVCPPQGGDGFELPCGAIDEVARVNFTEIRTALDPRPSDKGSPPRLVWVTRPEVETMNALRSRDYEAFYVRFKLEVLAGIWSSLSGLLSSSPGSRWHQGSHYTVVREPDAATGKIYQRTVDDSGRAVDIGSDRIYDAAPATDILLLYLEGDILADFADIYFTLQSLDSPDAYHLKEEFFTVIRRFWAGSQSLTSRYGSDLAAVVRMSQRAVPMPAQAPLLKQDWTNLRQSLVDRYGEGGRKAADLAGQDVHRPRIGPLGWPFASFPAGEVNVGLRLVYRQEWRNLGAQRGEVVRTVPLAPKRVERESTQRRVETTIEQGDTTRNLDEVVDEVVEATVEAMKWPLDFEGSINTGVRGLAAKTDMGLEWECRESSRDTSTRLSDIMRRMAGKIRDETAVAVSAEPEEGFESTSSTDVEDPTDQNAATHVYSRLQNRYEVLTRPAEIQNVVLVAEKLPTPAEIDLSWVRRHDWILAKALLDESFRDALDTIQRDLELDTKRHRLYEHLRANILHYQRAIWQQEDPQQRSMRYRKSGKKVPLEWRFELESGPTLTIDELGDRLAATNVDGQFAAYSAGREADLDQVIDPAGPIGYYGNCAVYQMRSEFGSGDLFSMLHFFKSPYLRPNPETGEPEVEDPVQIQISEDPAVVAASDQAIDQHRDEMLQYVPELRLELARARKQVSDGTDPGAVDRLEGQSGALRRHFATYLFRRERARQIALDTDGLVIDVIRGADPAHVKPERSDGGIDLGEVPEGYRLILESGRGIEPLSANGHRDAEVERVILSAGGGERTPSLLAGAGAPQAQERVIIARENGGLSLTAAAGAGAAHPNEWVIFARRDGERNPRLLAGGGAPRAHDPEAERVILARGDGERTPSLIAGTGAPHAHERVIFARDGGGPRLTAVAGAGAPQARERLFLSGSEGERTPNPLAGGGAPQAHDPEAEQEVILARKEEGLRLTAVAGAGAPHTHEGVILARGDGERMPSLRAGRAHDPEAERVILSAGGGERTPSLVAGAGAPQAQERMILARDNGGLRLTTAAGAGAARPNERVIFARREGGLRLAPVAGPGAAHPHERVILARDDEWLRPSLVAG